MKTKTHLTAEFGQASLDAVVAELPDEREVDRLLSSYVRLDPHRSGLDRARIVAGEDSAPIWAIIGDLRGGGGIAATADGYRLPQEAIVAAVGFYRRHRTVIDHRLAINDGTIRSIG